MHKDIAKEFIVEKLAEGEELQDFFAAETPMNIWLFLLIGPLVIFFMRFYYIGVTDRGIHFHRLNLLGKFVRSHFRAYDDIEEVHIGTGFIQLPIKLHLKSGQILKLKAQKKGMDRVAKIQMETVEFLQTNIQAAA